MCMSITARRGYSAIAKEHVVCYPLLATRRQVRIYKDGTLQEPYDTLFDYGKYVRLGAGEGLRSPAIEKSRIEAVDAQPLAADKRAAAFLFRGGSRSQKPLWSRRPIRRPQRRFPKGRRKSSIAALLAETMQRIDPQDPRTALYAYLSGRTAACDVDNAASSIPLRLQRQPETRRAAGTGQSGERGRGASRYGKDADDSEHRRQSVDAGKNCRRRVQQQCGGGQRARQTVEIRVRGVDGRAGEPDQAAGLFRGQTAGFHARPCVAVAGGGAHGPANAAGRAVSGHRRAFPRRRGAGRPADETLLCPMRIPSSAVGTTAGRSADAERRPLFLPSDRQPAGAVVPASRYRGGRAEGRRSLCGPDCCSGAARGPGSGCSRMRSCCPPMPITNSTKPISPSSRPASPARGTVRTSSVRRV